MSSSFSELDIDISKGMLMGEGIDLRNPYKNKPGEELEKVFVPWNMLNSHFMCFGTTRQGKTRLMAFMMRQIIEKGDHLILVEPKGSAEQEVFSWIAQYANEFNSLDRVLYWSPERPDMSVKINLLYGQNDEEATATVLGSMSVEDEFYEDIANEILMGVLPAFSFLEERVDPLVIEIMERTEYLKAKLIDPTDTINKEMLGNQYNSGLHGRKIDVAEDMIAQNKGNPERIRDIKKAAAVVKKKYENSSGGEIPIRRFVTFEDLAGYTSPEKIKKLHDLVITEIAEAKKEKRSLDMIKRGERAERELEKLSSRDAGYFSKVSTSYAVTMTKLSTGNVGKLLCSSKINVLRDEFYKKDKRVILVAQPFPMKYTKAANMSIKMLMSMMNNVMGEVGVSGIANKKRVHVMVDEAGSITNNLMLSLANKGGGLGLSLYLYSQSFADYKDVLGEEGATILADNANTKAFFLVNDDKSAETVSALIGGKKKGDMSYGSNEGTTGRLQARAVDEALVPPHLITQLDAMSYVLKTGNQVYMMAAPFQRDPYLEVVFNSENSEKRADKYESFIEKQKQMLKNNKGK